MKFLGISFGNDGDGNKPAAWPAGCEGMNAEEFAQECETFIEAHKDDGASPEIYSSRTWYERWLQQFAGK